MNNQEEKFHILQELKLSAIEKTEIRDSLKHFMASHPLPRKSHSSWFARSHLTISPYGGISMRMTKVLVFSFIGIIFAGGTLTFASGSSIPGELLYPIKINIKEPLEGSLKTDPTEKLAWKEQKVTRRIEEIQTLKTKKQVTKREATIAQAVLIKHVEELNQTFIELKEENQAAILATTAQLIPKTETILLDTVADVSSAISPEIPEEEVVIEPTENEVASSVPETTQSPEMTLDMINDTDTEKIKDVLTQEVLNQIQKIKESAEINTKEEIPNEVPPIKTEPSVPAVDDTQVIKLNVTELTVTQAEKDTNPTLKPTVEQPQRTPTRNTTRE